MKYMILLMTNLISFFTVKPQNTEELVSSIQNYYGIEEEYQLTEENIHHIDSHYGWLAYYENGEIYICDSECSELSDSEFAFVLAHELYHHEQTLTIPTFEDDYTNYANYYEREANESAREYVKDVFGKNVNIVE